MDTSETGDGVSNANKEIERGERRVSTAKNLVSHSSKDVLGGEKKNQLAICLLMSPQNIGRGVELALKAEDWEYDVFIGIKGGDSKILEFLDRRAVAGITQFPQDVPQETIRSELRTQVQEQGYPGVIFHDTDHEFDLAANIAKFESQQKYAIGSTSTPNSEYGIIVGVPAYNEEIGIGSVVHKTQQYADEVVVVDDGSTDDTVDIAKKAGATVLEHDINRGKGAAVQTFFEHVGDYEFDVAILIDGDGQHNPAQIPKVVEPVIQNQTDVSIGSRYLEDSQVDETPRYRRFGQKVLDLLTLGSTGRSLTDTQSGFRAFSKTAVDELELSTDGLGVESEMIDSASEKELEITETPIEVRYEGIDGQTYNPLHHGLTVVAFVLQLVRDKHPLLFFGIPGLILMIAGSLWGIDGILIYQETGNFFPAKALVSGFLTIIGTLCVFCGLILNRISNMITQANQ